VDRRVCGVQEAGIQPLQLSVVFVEITAHNSPLPIVCASSLCY
jgi:hypothetical protein